MIFYELSTVNNTICTKMPYENTPCPLQNPSRIIFLGEPSVVTKFPRHIYSDVKKLTYNNVIYGSDQ
jgi:hypothetical protein